MWKSKDVSLILLLAVLSFVYSMLIAQLPTLIVGVVGLNYIFIFGYGILIGLSFLIYKGKKWRFGFQTALLALLMIPTFAMGTPFDVLARLPLIIGGFLSDFIFNSIYNYFCTKKRLKYWAILATLFTIGINLFLTVLNMVLFYPPTVMTSFIHVVSLLSPVIIIEALIGGYIGFVLFNRIKNTSVFL